MQTRKENGVYFFEVALITVGCVDTVLCRTIKSTGESARGDARGHAIITRRADDPVF